MSDRKKFYIKLLLIIFVIGIFILAVISFFLPHPTAPPVSRQPSASPAPRGEFVVTGRTPSDDTIKDFGQQFELQFSLPPETVNVTTDPSIPLIVTVYPSKIGGYATISPKDYWYDETTYTVRVRAGSVSTTGEKLQSDYTFKFKVEYYKGL